MANTINIAYPSGSAEPIKILYDIEQADNLQTINCSVESKTFPIWLQLRKFSISSVGKSGNFVTLFNEINSSKNMDTSLFIDLVYNSIMQLEHYKYS